MFKQTGIPRWEVTNTYNKLHNKLEITSQTFFCQTMLQRTWLISLGVRLLSYGCTRDV